ncbi:phosphotransferase [Modestobacter sp. I12A-02628]|uniref:Aminoglycoside phosphotransferase family protein n=1 Tax=Goekera deserti TaxID=2497753 RepID=A0A7K3W9E5_9ACTN|nr:aminoglycoside phosphotransferase family protein [Goekera deserti]MPQ98776.1 phosphotransferase [Goekera deserti]NDI49726.1 phosphotransferase [Goekera deserti]NEL53081.1 aminoglycoside phosphotransferase family protein [Goekera deserti]
MTTSLLAPAASPALAAGWPPSLQLLLGEAAVDLWSAALAPTGAGLRSLRATSVTLQPDGAAIVQYAASLVTADGRPARDTLAATTGSRIPDGAAVLAGDVSGTTVEVGLWRWPHDPALPALAWATSAAAVRARLPGLGVPAEDARLRLRAYRPGRRAVVEVTSARGTWYLKVVRPRAAAPLAERHAVLGSGAPVPPVLAGTPDGVLVLPGLPGTPMRALLAGDGAGLPDLAAVDAVLDALPAAALDLPAPGRHAPGDALGRARGHAAVLGMVAPHLRPRLDRLCAALEGVDPGRHERVPVHGDLYEAQLLVTDGAVTGLLDVDTAGAGHRVDDWATLLAHLAVLEQLLPDPATVIRTRAAWTAELAGRWPDDALRARVAAVLLGLATGPFRVQQAGWPARTEARLALAEAALTGG